MIRDFAPAWLWVITALSGLHSPGPVKPAAAAAAGAMLQGPEDVPTTPLHDPGFGPTRPLEHNTTDSLKQLRGLV